MYSYNSRIFCLFNSLIYYNTITLCLQGFQTMGNEGVLWILRGSALDFSDFSIHEYFVVLN